MGVLAWLGFRGPVRSGFLPSWAWTETGTGLYTLGNCYKPDRNRTKPVLCGSVRSNHRFGPTFCIYFYIANTLLKYIYIERASTEKLRARPRWIGCRMHWGKFSHSYVRGCLVRFMCCWHSMSMLMWPLLCVVDETCSSIVVLKH